MEDVTIWNFLKSTVKNYWMWATRYDDVDDRDDNDDDEDDDNDDNAYSCDDFNSDQGISYITDIHQSWQIAQQSTE